MKTINRITFTLVLLSAFWSLSAQDFRFGIQAGTNFAVQGPIGDYYNNDEIRVGLHAGVFGNYSFNESIYLQTELNYDQKGAKDGDYKINYDYLSVPVLFNYSLGKSWKTPLRFNIYTGPYAAFLLNAESKIDNGEINETLDLKDNTNNTEFGWITGFGMRYPINEQSILFNVRLGLGLSAFDKNDSEPKNKYIGVSLGYEF